MSDQYDLAMAKMRLAERMVFAVWNRDDNPGRNPADDLGEVLRLFGRAFNGITQAIEHTVYTPPSPEPEDLARP
ncbi:MAG: hypothetical protein HY331_04700 [Chloroflexi bacterium]|nr:hypothetical protein [Chloroflexota bacterium]